MEEWKTEERKKDEGGKEDKKMEEGECKDGGRKMKAGGWIPESQAVCGVCVSRLTFHVSRFTSHVSRLTFHISPKKRALQHKLQGSLQ
jgi:hypothetical protein